MELGASQFKTLKAPEACPKYSKVASRFFMIDDIDEGEGEENDLNLNKVLPYTSAVESGTDRL